MTSEAEKILTEYLQQQMQFNCVNDDGNDDDDLLVLPRIKCCNSSRSIYCTECYKLLIDKKFWPSSIRNNSLQLPFHIDILLDEKERRTSSTGMHSVVIFNTIEKIIRHNRRQGQEEGLRPQGRHQEQQQQQQENHPQQVPQDEHRKQQQAQQEFGPEEGFEEEMSNDHQSRLDGSQSQQSEDYRETIVRLYDLKRVDMPAYDPNEQGVFVLFPEPGSVPIAEVKDKVKKLVVLDVKWSKQVVKLDPTIASLPKVHLAAPPAQSNFWRWHNSGDGMLSTIEAIYFAAMEMTADGTWSSERRECLIDVMWLFALQYSIIHARSELESRPPPYTEAWKQYHRALRQKQRGNPPKKRAEEEKFYKDLSR